MDHLNLFTWLDYSLFFGLLASSALIGAYFGFFDRKQNSPKEYLHGGKNMKVFPIAASLIASDISGITLLALPTDIYMNGSAYIICVFSSIIMTIVIIHVFLPVFYNLQVTSSYEYLKLRFSDRTCKMASCVFALISTLYLPVIIYIPALAFNQVSGLDLNIIIPLTCMICIFYTTIGGIKAVVWTDTLQMCIMIGSLLVVFTLGFWVEGGFGNIWNTASKGGRVDFNLNADPTDKNASITVFIGMTVLLCGYGSNPIFTQRFLAVPTFRKAKLTAVIFCCGTIIFKLISWLLGLTIYSYYSECSPLKTGQIQKPDQILPYYIMEVSSSLPGLPGIFIAGLFCAALSSISSGLNTMAGTIYEDFIKQFMPQSITDKKASDIMKLIVFVLGIIFIALVFLVQYLGTIMQLSITLGGIVVGPMFALFVLGMLVPMINEKGVLWGCAAGLAFITWVIVGAYYNTIAGKLPVNFLPLSTKGCEGNMSFVSAIVQTNPAPLPESEQPMYLYRISYYYYSFIGFLATAAVAFPVSLLTGGHKQTVDLDLLSPIIHPFLSRKKPNKIVLEDIDKPDLNKPLCN